jgi:hypothetical protein
MYRFDPGVTAEAEPASALQVCAESGQHGLARRFHSESEYKLESAKSVRGL